MLPVVVQYSLPAVLGTTSIALTQAALTGLFQLNGTYGTSAALGSGVLGTAQQRVTVTSEGNDSGIYFHLIGLNQAGFTVSEFLAGGNGSGAGTSAVTVQSNLDYKTILSIEPSASSIAQTLATTAASVSAGTNGVGSSLWNIVNWHAMPSNISYGCVLQSGAATFSIQYTYDDPNNLPPNVPYPQPFTLSTINNATATIDGYSNEPITGWRLLISAGTGTVRAIGTQGGIGSP